MFKPLLYYFLKTNSCSVILHQEQTITAQTIDRKMYPIFLSNYFY